MRCENGILVSILVCSSGCLDFGSSAVPPQDAVTDDVLDDREAGDESAAGDDTAGSDTGGDDMGADEMICPSPLIVCSGICTNPDTDRENCGRCGSECVSPAICDDGACICPADQPDLKMCGGQCVDIMSSRENCGDCGRACADAEVCGGTGTCSLDCQAGLSICGAPPDQFCSDLSTDPDNCGACGFSCSGHGTCAGGACVCSEGFAGAHCDGCARLYTGYPSCEYDPARGTCQCQEEIKENYPICGDKICRVTDADVANCRGCGAAAQRCCACRSCANYLPVPLECSEAECKCKEDDGGCPGY